MKRNNPSIQVVSNKVFTDRESYRQLFWDCYAQCEKDIKENNDDAEIRILNYYGFGGIGKSSLLEKIKEEMAEKLVFPRCIVYDFKAGIDARHVLSTLKNILTREYGFQFPLFEMAIFSISMKSGQDAKEPEIKSYLEENPILNRLFIAGRFVPMVGCIFSSSIAADHFWAAKKAKDLKKKYDDFIKNNCLEAKSSKELEDLLPTIFAMDFNANVEECNTPVVIMLDTYEKCVNEAALVGDDSSNDLWLRGENGLVVNTYNVFWVIAGREKLRWADYDSDWESSITAEPVGKFSEYDSTKYLTKAGVAQELCHDLYLLTDGTPLYLDLCVDRNDSLLKQGKKPTIEDFGNDTKKLLACFVEYLDRGIQVIIYMLSCIRFWTDDLVSEVGPKAVTSFNPLSYRAIKRMSIVTDDKVNYSMHDIVADILSEHCPENISDDAFKYTKDYYVKKLKEISPNSDEYDKLVNAFMAYGSRYLNKDEIIAFYIECICPLVKELEGRAKFSAAYGIMSQLQKYFEDSPFVYALALEEYSKLLLYEGNYSQAYENLHKVRQIYEDNNAMDEEKEHNLDWLEGLIVTRLGDYQKALKISEKLYFRDVEVLGEEHPDTISAMNNLSIRLANVGQYKKALELNRKVLEMWTKLYGEEHPDTIRAMNNLVNRLGEIGENEEALELSQRVVELRLKVLGEEHLDTIAAMNNLANRLGEIGENEEALELSQRVVELRLKVLGEKHPNTIDAMYNLSVMLSNMGDFEEALDLGKKVLDLYTKVLGEEHSNTIESLVNYSFCLGQVGRNEEALNYGIIVYEKFRLLYGDDNDKTINALSNVLRFRVCLHDVDGIIENCMRELEIAKHVLGEEDPVTVELYETMGLAYKELGDMSVAKTIMIEVVEGYKNVIGEDSPVYKKALKTLNEL